MQKGCLVKDKTILIMKKAILYTLLLLLVSCGKRTIEEINTDVSEQQKYFPLAIGQSIDYQVDSITIVTLATGVTRDSSTTFIRETITDTLRDTEGHLQWKVERFERTADSLPWKIERIWTAEITDQKAVRTEENLRFLRLVFPMTKRSEWNGNLWIDPNRTIKVADQSIRPFTNWNYEVDSIDIPRQVGAFSFDSVLVVTEVDDENVIEKRLSRTIYAKNIGLVYKEQWILDSQYCNSNPVPTDCETKPWVEKAEKGYVIRQTVLRY